MKYEWRNLDQTILAEIDGNHTTIIEPGHAEWAALSMAPNILPYLAPIQPDPVAQSRDAMVVSRFQAMAALLDAGLLSSVNTALYGAGPLAQLAWAEATEFRRNSPAIAGLAAGLGLTDDQVDDLFRSAMVIYA